MRLPHLPEVPLELLGPLRRLLWAANVLREAVADALTSPEQRLLPATVRALNWALDVIAQWLDHVELQGLQAETAGRATAARAARRNRAAWASGAGTGHELAAALAAGQEEASLPRWWPPTAERYLWDIQGLVNLGCTFRGVLATTVTHPLEEVLVKDAAALTLADECLNEWIEAVGVAPHELEDVLSESILLADAMRQAARGAFGDNSRSKGKGKQLRTGGVRDTVKRR